jgi:hypothetical protein
LVPISVLSGESAEDGGLTIDLAPQQFEQNLGVCAFY